MEEIVIGIQKVQNVDRLRFHMKEEIKNHFELARRLELIEGVEHENCAFAVVWENHNRYDFGLSKGQLFDWDNKLLSEIKDCITQYFLEKKKKVIFEEVKPLTIDPEKTYYK